MRWLYARTDLDLLCLVTHAALVVVLLRSVTQLWVLSETERQLRLRDRQVDRH